MVVIRALCALAVLTGLVGCGQSLFDAHGDRDGGPGDDGGDDDGGLPVPTTCPAECLADAAADFDKSPSSWSYLEEGPMHLWVGMMQNGKEWSGTDTGNTVRRCLGDSADAACKALPGALLVTAAGDSSAFYPALELKLPDAGAQVLHLVVRAHVPRDSAPQNIRLYRNGREDVLFAVTGLQGDTAEKEVIVDALPGDRFLVSVDPTGVPGGSAAIHFFASSMGESFPATCQLAATFPTGTSGTMIEDLCTNRDLNFVMGLPPGTPVTPAFTQGPFPELGDAIDLMPGRYLRATAALARADTPVTVQLWFRIDTLPPTGKGWIFDDQDPDLGGGNGLSAYQPAQPRLEITAFSDTDPLTEVTASDAVTTGTWHFLRVVDANDGTIKVCFDGRRLGSLEVPPSRFTTNNQVHLGKMASGGSGAVFDGAIDDVRVFSAALPCD
jgi:Concanavalin A-like lectin/glucanases superfamily